ncbi:ABC transporter substrate-binding protein [Roseicitreum antarcticum]|uniref:Peptide/nickel transport system substrate-binding protein n=1 Tax=Roseicitreum antarcticum TaxID=564137 RepID=A0A1H2TIQ9_9RHOB|nr:ABC transporter substrate-binding protein [Roseicitreum antarcticum]SDW43565.1 peptide/nickel transport system substrate-binding protein [Roseicitreum antarcticum]
MKRTAMLAASTMLVAASMTIAAQAETFRWASTTDPQTMDPHAANVAPVTSFLNNIYEGLVRRNADMAIEPSLATSWEPLTDEPGWRFHLREGVRFHGGEDFTADDVLFSYERAIAEQSDVRSWFAPVTDVRVVDDFTVDFVTAAPNPLFPDSIANFLILDRGWAEANGAEVPARDEEKYTTRNTNGSGPFILTARETGVEIRLIPNPDWWDTATHNLTEAVFNPIENAATGLAALLSGEIDMLSQVAVRDVARLRETEGIRTFEGLETRVIMLGFNHTADALWSGAAGTDGNPFADPLVRRAAAHAIDVLAINQVLMSGMAEPASQLLPEGLSGWSAAHADRPAHEPDTARALMAEAGQADGFSFGLRCTNDRYLNDEALCQAVTGMLQQVGLNAQPETMPVRNYWGELREGNFDMFLLGWSPGTFDAEHPIRFLAATPDGSVGTWNFGGFSDARVDELLPMIQQELDPQTRNAMLDEVAGILQDRVAYIPLYTEPLVWAARDGIDLVQRPDNFFMLRWVNVAQ